MILQFAANGCHVGSDFGHQQATVTALNVWQKDTSIENKAKLKANTNNIDPRHFQGPKLMMQ